MHYPQSWNLTIVFCLLHRNGVLLDKKNERVFYLFFWQWIRVRKCFYTKIVYLTKVWHQLLEQLYNFSIVFFPMLDDHLKSLKFLRFHYVCIQDQLKYRFFVLCGNLSIRNIKFSLLAVPLSNLILLQAII